MLKDRDIVEEMSTESISMNVDLFLSVLARDKSPATVATYRRALGVFTLWVDEQGGRVELSEIKLMEYPAYLRHQRKVRPNTLRTYVTALRQFFSFLAKRHSLFHDPAEKLKVKVDESADGRGILTDEEIRELYRVSKGEDLISQRDRAIMCCMLLEGLSETEVANCEYRDLENTIMGEELVVRGKGGKIRMLLNQQTFRCLIAYLNTRSEPIRPEDPLFLSHGPRESNKRLKVRTIRSRIRILLDRAGITRVEVSPQSLTHTSIYLLIKGGMSRETLRERVRPWRLYHRIDDLKSRGLIDPSF